MNFNESKHPRASDGKFGNRERAIKAANEDAPAPKEKSQPASAYKGLSDNERMLKAANEDATAPKESKHDPSVKTSAREKALKAADRDATAPEEEKANRNRRKEATQGKGLFRKETAQHFMGKEVDIYSPINGDKMYAKITSVTNKGYTVVTASEEGKFNGPKYTFPFEQGEDGYEQFVSRKNAAPGTLAAGLNRGRHLFGS